MNSTLKDYPSVDFKGDCGEGSGDKPNSATSNGMQVNSRVTVNGGEVNKCVVGNKGATIYEISLIQTSGVYEYKICVDGKGPSGSGGYIHLAFTDESGDTFYLKIYSSARKLHTIEYNSRKPNITTIWWCDYDFDVDVASSKTTKPDFRVTSPANK